MSPATECAPRSIGVHLVAALLLGFATAKADPPRIAIIIDDLGYQLGAGMRAIDLPGPVAYAVLPATPRAAALAEQAHQRGKEVLLHLPLQSESHSGPAEPGAIMLNMGREQLASAFSSSLASVPYASGVNSHRGSLLTRQPDHMSWLMQEIHDHGDLFFVDSFTTHRSIALDLARESGIPAVKRDVFLDTRRDSAAIAEKFTELKQLAVVRGLALGIGHPYPETLTFLEQALPVLAAEGIELIGISRLVALESKRGIMSPAAAEEDP